jgi:hypothetical protein
MTQMGRDITGTILAGLIVSYMLLSIPIELLKSSGILPREGFEDE